MPDRKQPPRAIDAPEPCWLRVRLTIHGGYVPARIFKTLAAEVDGRPADVNNVWESGDIISEREWLQLTHDRKRAKPF